MKCIFTGQGTEYEVNFRRISDHIVRLIGDVPAYDTGFTLSRAGHDDAWDYNAFTTVYRIGDGYVEYSDDGSVYVEPEQPEYIPDEPIRSDHEERIAALENQIASYESAYTEGVNGA